MTGGILGAFVSLDLFLFYFFHELALVPTFIMIGVWGRGATEELRHLPNHTLLEPRRTHRPGRSHRALRPVRR